MAAAAVNTFRLWLRDDIGLATDANANQMIAVGIASFNELVDLNEEDVKNLCKQLRGGVPPTPVSFAAEKKLKLSVYAAKLYELVGRTVERPLFLTNRLRYFDSYKEVIDRAGDLDRPETPVVSKKMPIDKALDAFPNVLRSILGVRQVPLSYVIRPAWPNNQRPALGAVINNRPYSADFDSFQEELIAFCPHDGPGWEEDNATVFQLVSDMVKDSSQASTLQGFKRNRNGRDAYLTLCQHNLSNSTWDDICRKAENTQTMKTWNGKNHRYTLKTHCDHHRDAFNDMMRAAEFTTYQVPDEYTRVSRLLNSIQADHIPAIAAAKTTIQANATMRGDFEQTVDFLILNCPKTKQYNNVRNISMIQTSQLDADEQAQLDQLRDAGVSLPDGRMFYPTSEYGDFTDDQKTLLYLMRKENGQIGSRGKKKPPSQKQKQPKSAKKLAKLLKKQKKENKKLKRNISALKQQQDDGDASSSESEAEPEPPQKKGKKVKFNQRGGHS